MIGATADWVSDAIAAELHFKQAGAGTRWRMRLIRPMLGQGHG